MQSSYGTRCYSNVNTFTRHDVTFPVLLSFYTVEEERSLDAQSHIHKEERGDIELPLSPSRTDSIDTQSDDHVENDSVAMFLRNIWSKTTVEEPESSQPPTLSLLTTNEIGTDIVSGDESECLKLTALGAESQAINHTVVTENTLVSNDSRSVNRENLIDLCSPPSPGLFNKEIVTLDDDDDCVHNGDLAKENVSIQDTNHQKRTYDPLGTYTPARLVERTGNSRVLSNTKGLSRSRTVLLFQIEPKPYVSVSVQTTEASREINSPQQ